MPKEIEINRVAFVRTTHEPVFVLRIEGNVATTRRGVMAQSGAYYKTEEFTLPELQAEDPSRINFESIFREPEGEITISGPDGNSESLLQ